MSATASLLWQKVWYFWWSQSQAFVDENVFWQYMAFIVNIVWYYCVGGVWEAYSLMWLFSASATKHCCFKHVKHWSLVSVSIVSNGVNRRLFVKDVREILSIFWSVKHFASFWWNTCMNNEKWLKGLLDTLVKLLSISSADLCITCLLYEVNTLYRFLRI